MIEIEPRDDTSTVVEGIRELPRAALVATACVGLAALSLLLPWDLSFDPWGWALWGREITSPHIAFNTELYPAWKPLPVIFTSVFSLFGDAGPLLWLVVARTGALAAVVLAYRVGARLGGRVAGVAAAAGVLLIPESLRYFAGGASEPLLVALVLGAIDRHMNGRRDQALALGFAAALLRPETWPFLFAYAVAYAWGHPRRALIVGGLFAALALLWFVPEWIGAGDPFYGAWLARVSLEARQTQSLASPELTALRRALGLALAPLGLAAVFAVVLAARRRQPLPLVLAAGALAWIAIVVAMTAKGYAGLGRFALPAGAIICVVGGAGIAWLIALLPSGRRLMAVAATLLVFLPFAVSRTERIATAAAVATSQDTLEDGFRSVVDRVGGAKRVRACERFTVDSPFRPAAAWRLGVPVATLANVTAPRLVFRVTHRVIPGYEGRQHLSHLAPVPPARRIARLNRWDVIVSLRPSPCLSIPRRLSGRRSEPGAPRRS